MSSSQIIYRQQHKFAKRRYFDAPSYCRCEQTIQLGDKSWAQCGRFRVVGKLCLQHHKIAKGKV